MRQAIGRRPSAHTDFHYTGMGPERWTAGLLGIITECHRDCGPRKDDLYGHAKAKARGVILQLRFDPAGLLQPLSSSTPPQNARYHFCNPPVTGETTLRGQEGLGCACQFDI